MKHIGKIAVLAMAAALALALTACGGGAASSSASKSASSSSTSASASASASASSSASVSTTNADTYTNDAFGLSFTLPTGWSFADAATLKQLNSPVANAANFDKIDMVAMSADKNTAVVVAIIPPGSQTSGQAAEAYLEAQNTRMQETLTSGNYTATTNSATVTFDGLTRTLPASLTTITADGKTLYIGQAIDTKDGYFFYVVVTGTSEADVTNAYKAFKAAA